MLFRERLKTLREDNRFTQQHLAEVLNVSSGAVSHYENGTREPAIDTLIQMADIFNVSVDYLVGNTETNILPNEMNKSYCKGISTGNFLKIAISLEPSRRQTLNYVLKCMELEQFVSNKK